MGVRFVEEIADSIPTEDSIRVKARSIMGTEIPLVEYTPREKERPPYSFYSTSDSLDEACLAFERVKELTARLATVETSAYRLAESIKKTQKRANALKNITIPSYQDVYKRQLEPCGQRIPKKLYPHRDLCHRRPYDPDPGPEAADLLRQRPAP